MSLKVILYLLIFIPIFALSQEHQLTDQQIRKIIIQESIKYYLGNCPCPYNLARNGTQCGRRSAWSRPGGYSPVCYDHEISDIMVKEWQIKLQKNIKANELYTK